MTTIESENNATQNCKLRKSGDIDSKLIQGPSSSELVAQLDQAFCAATGVKSKELAVRLVAQLQSLQIGEPDFTKRMTLATQAL